MILSKKSLTIARPGTQAVKGSRRMYIHATVPDNHLKREEEEKRLMSADIAVGKNECTQSDVCYSCSFVVTLRYMTFCSDNSTL